MYGGTESTIYDADNQLVSREYTGQGEDLLTTFAYDYMGDVTQDVMYYGGTTVVSTNDTGFDARGNITSIHDVTSASTTVNFDYAYDVADELTQEIDNGASTISYAYDATGQLTSAGTTSYAFDANGNDANSGDATTTDNELTLSIDPATGDTISMTYDHAGNEVARIDRANREARAKYLRELAP